MSTQRRICSIEARLLTRTGGNECIQELQCDFTVQVRPLLPLTLSASVHTTPNTSFPFQTLPTPLPGLPPSPFPLISLESFSSYWSPSPLIQPSRRTKVTTPPYSDPHIGRWCRPGKLFDRIGRRAAEMAARRSVARLPRKRRIAGLTSPQRLPPDSSAIVKPGQGSLLLDAGHGIAQTLLLGALEAFRAHAGR
jgi:hypothetical protein